MIVMPSLLAAPPLTLKESIAELIEEGFHIFHVDMMDYHFTNNFGLTPQICEDILKTFPEVTLDVHLMTNPTPPGLIARLQDMGISDISVHPNTMANSNNLRTALSPEEPLTQDKKLLLLAVSPGFSNQTLQTHVLEKAIQAKALGANIILDGGINLSTLDAVLNTQPDAIVIGSGLFGADRKQLIQKLKTDLPSSTFRY